MRRIFLAFAFAIAFVRAGCGADNSTANSAPPNSQRLTLFLLLMHISTLACAECLVPASTDTMQ